MAADRLKKDPGIFLWVSLTFYCFRKVAEELVVVGVTRSRQKLYRSPSSRPSSLQQVGPCVASNLADQCFFFFKYLFFNGVCVWGGY